MPSQSFFIGSNNHVIDAITVSLSGSLHFSLDGFSFLTATETDALRLHVCDGDYDFSTATPAEKTLSTGQTANPRLVAPGGDPHGVPQPAGEPRRDGRAGDYRHGAGRAGADRRRDPIMDTDGLPSSFTYQWVRVDADGMSNPADIADATAATYPLTAADAGKKIKVQVSFTDG